MLMDKGVPYLIVGILLLGFVDFSVAASKKKSTVKIPEWVSEDCLKKDGSYFFVGYGEGQNASTASRNSLISSRQSALTCLFGGTITSNISIREDNNSLDFNSVTDLELDYSYVNWGGYQKVPDRSFALNDERTKIYIQYQWAALAISVEKDRLDKMASQIAQTKAKEKEISVQRSVIQRQKQQLGELNRQAEELAAIKTASEKAVARLKAINQNRARKKQSIQSVIANLYCGITLDELTSVYREADKIRIVNSEYDWIASIDFYWMDYVVSIDTSTVGSALGIKRHDVTRQYLSKRSMLNPQNARRYLGSFPITFIYENKRLTNKGFDLCKAS